MGTAVLPRPALPVRRSLKFRYAVPIIVRVKGTLTDEASLKCGVFRVSTDVVVFAIRGEAFQVLLRRRDPDDPAGATVWALPGGDVGASESLDDCAGRTLAEQTGMRDVYLEQLYTFGEPERRRDHRTVSVAYYALVSGDRSDGVEAARLGHWCDIDRLPALYLDHERIILVARERLVAKLEYSTIAFQLMPEYFTLSELQQVYETICDRSIDKRNFRKRILALDHVEPTDEKRRHGSHRPARLYRYTARDAIQYLK